MIGKVKRALVLGVGTSVVLVARLGLAQPAGEPERAADGTSATVASDPAADLLAALADADSKAEGASKPAPASAGSGPAAKRGSDKAGAAPSDAPAQADSDAQLRWDRPVLCLSDPKGTRLYAQCNLDSKVCLFHDGCMPGTSGKKCVALDRLKGCSDLGSGAEIYERLVKQGVRFERARAEAPPGWERDELGRVFQTQFDMNRRLWLGASWHAAYGPQDRYELGTVAFDTGLRAEWLSDDTRTLHRLHVLNGELSINPLSAKGTLLRYDGSRESEIPLFRLTTFWPPERHDAYLNMGWFAEIGTVELRPRGSAHETTLRFAAAGPTWDFWHSANMTSFVRFRLGAAFDDLLRYEDELTHNPAFTPVSALEADVLFDDAGLHRLTVSSGFELPLVWDGVGTDPDVRFRFLNEAAYELVLIAINDQPLSMRFAVGGGYRDDLLEAASGWELTGSAGLRFSFWAPAPSADDAKRISEVRTP